MEPPSVVSRAPEQVHEGAFARAGAAFDGEEFAGVDDEIHAFEDGDVAVAHAIGLGDAAGAKDRDLTGEAGGERLMGG